MWKNVIFKPEKCGTYVWSKLRKDMFDKFCCAAIHYWKLKLGNVDADACWCFYKYKYTPPTNQIG